MRFGQGGKLTAAQQEKRELLRLETAERFHRSEPNAMIARHLRVTERSVWRWWRTWLSGGALAA
jgi:hypothetical protein